MPVALLDLVDCNLQLWHGDRHVQSPGYALLQDRQYLFGAAAREQARLQPLNVNTRFWWQLGTDPLQPALGPARHAGDLAHAHLQALHREAGLPAEVLLAVPGSMTHGQLSLLLGIAQQCDFNAVGLVNRSSVLASLGAPQRRLFHLEVQLHQAVVTELAGDAAGTAVQRTAPVPGCGLLQIQEQLVRVISAAFVQQTRFDPRRKAATEQQLYNALPVALRALAGQRETNIEVNGYRARISAQELAPAGRPLFEGLRALLAGDSETRLLADPLAGLLPGLSDEFPTVEILAPDAIHRALQLHAPDLVQREQSLDFVTRLPWLAPAADARPAAAREASTAMAAPTATHLLRGDRAIPLSPGGTALANGWELVAAPGGWQLRGSGTAARVNGRASDPGQRLGAGDSISIGEQFSARLIEVVSG